MDGPDGKHFCRVQHYMTQQVDKGFFPTVHQSTAIKFNSKTKTDRGNSL